MEVYIEEEDLFSFLSNCFGVKFIYIKVAKSINNHITVHDILVIGFRIIQYMYSLLPEYSGDAANVIIL